MSEATIQIPAIVGESKKPRKSKWAHLPREERIKASQRAFHARNPDYMKDRLEGKLVLGKTPKLPPAKEPRLVIDWSVCQKCGGKKIKNKGEPGWRCNACIAAKLRAKRAPLIAAKKAEREKGRVQKERERNELRAEDARQSAILKARSFSLSDPAFFFTESETAAFWQKTAPVGDCIEWQPQTRQIAFMDFPPHRVAWFLQNGAIHPDIRLRRTCGSNRCVNWAHIEEYSYMDVVRRAAAFRGKARAEYIPGKRLTTPTLTPEQEARFWSYVEKTDGCWNWKSKLSVKGYAQFNISGVNFTASRIAYKLHYGAIDDSLQIHHSCDNRRCVSWACLSQGDDMENMRQAKERDRVAFGERNAAHRLNRAQVIEIYTRGNLGEATRKLADEFGAEISYVRDIIKGLARERETRLTGIG